MKIYLFETTDPRGHIVRLARKQFEEHIIRNHSEIDDFRTIKICVIEPDFITKDANHSSREVYFREGVFSDNPQRWIKVVVDNGIVITAYRQRRLKQGEEIIWQPSKI